MIEEANDKDGADTHQLPADDAGDDQARWDAAPVDRRAWGDDHRPGAAALTLGDGKSRVLRVLATERDDLGCDHQRRPGRRHSPVTPGSERRRRIRGAASTTRGHCLLQNSIVSGNKAAGGKGQAGADRRHRRGL